MAVLLEIACWVGGLFSVAWYRHLVVHFSPNSTTSMAADKDSFELSAIVRAHWRGDLGLWGVLVRAPLLLCGLFALWSAVMLVVASQGTGWLARNNHWVALLNASLLIVALLWWSIGSFRTINEMLSKNALAFAAVAYVFVLVASWNFCSLAFEAWVDTAQDALRTSHDISAFDKEVAKLRQRKPWTVIAVPEINRISVSGPIGFGSADRLRTVLDANPELKLLELDSPGGFVEEEYKLAGLVEERGLDTLVLGKCSSACTGVFLAGKRRFVGNDAELEFHQSGYKGRPRDTRWSYAEYMTAIDYNEKGVDAVFAKTAMNTSYYAMWRPAALEVKRAGFATDWWAGRGELYR